WVVIQYGDDAVTEISLRSYSNSREVKSAIEKIGQKGGLLQCRKALSLHQHALLQRCQWNRGGAPNVAVVLVDGWPHRQGGGGVRLARELCVGPTASTPCPVTSWFALRKAVQPLVKRVCDTDQPLVQQNLPQRQRHRLRHRRLQQRGNRKLRTVRSLWATSRGSLRSLTPTRGSELCSTPYEQRLEFGFGQYNNNAELLKAIKRVSYWSGGTSTGAAITFIMIVITDGRRGFRDFWERGQDELEYIATDPDKEHSFFVDEFDNLYKFVPKIIHNICQEFNSQPRN
uniref:VWFA domain-containing protein n=1 Tax=Cyclopterus lumpus TaxID=8103 RepID=A0A8C3AKZ4_CYCLU